MVFAGACDLVAAKALWVVSYNGHGLGSMGVSARGNAFFGGVHCDELVTALVRSEWAPNRRI
jgi:hypothetical protein